MTEIVDARPAISIDLAQTAGAFDDLSSVTWSLGLEAFAERVSLNRGRQHELRSTDPSLGSLLLDNSDRRFDPTHTAGPYGVNLSSPRRRVRIPMRWGTPRTITGATNTTPIVVTSAGHGFSNNSLVHQSGVFGNLAANGYFEVANVTANTYELFHVYTGASVAGSGTYTSGGTAQPMFWRFHGYVADFPTRWRGQGDAVAEVELYDAFALFAEIPIPGSPWELEVRRDSPVFWFSPRSGDEALDLSGHHHHGTYQGRGAVEGGIIPGYDGSGYAPNRLDTPGARAAFPHKSLITGFPFSIEAVFRSGMDRTSAKVMAAAYSAAGSIVGNQGVVLSVTAQPGSEGKVRGNISDMFGTVASTVHSSMTVDDGQPHHVVWRAYDYNDMEIWVDGVDVTTVVSSTSVFPDDLSIGWAMGNVPAIAYGDYSFATQEGDALGDVVFYDYPLPDARIAAHAEAALTGWAGDYTGERLHRILDWLGWPTADRDIDTGRSQLPAGLLAGNLLPYVQAIERAEAGLTYMGRNGKVTHRDRYRKYTAPGNVSQWTFGGGSGEVAYDPPAIFGGAESEHVTRAQGNRVGGPQQTVVSANEGAAGVNVVRALSPPLTDLHVLTDDMARDRLHHELARYEDPRVRVRSVTVRPQEDPTVAWPKVLGVADGAMVTFKAAPPGGGAEFSQASHIEAVREVWTSDDVTITYALSPADTGVSYWVLGTSQLGISTVLGF